ncbi:MAG: hypothetical protein ABIJ22_04610 [Patescibacteria group bacterium]
MWSLLLKQNLSRLDTITDSSKLQLLKITDSSKLSTGYLLYDGEINLIKNDNKKIFLLPWWII